jgi:hypothetical protein
VQRVGGWVFLSQRYKPSPQGLQGHKRRPNNLKQTNQISLIPDRIDKRRISRLIRSKEFYNL